MMVLADLLQGDGSDTMEQKGSRDLNSTSETMVLFLPLTWV